MKHKNKGFTLVELIVVLVILAILAALLVPALTGYIDKAKEKKLVAETRMVVMAVQTVASEAYGQIGADKGLSSTITEDWTSLPASDQHQQWMVNTYRKSKNLPRYLIPIQRQSTVYKGLHRVGI